MITQKQADVVTKLRNNGWTIIKNTTEVEDLVVLSHGKYLIGVDKNGKLDRLYNEGDTGGVSLSWFHGQSRRTPEEWIWEDDILVARKK